MTLYLWLLFHQVFITCTQAGCIQASSNANFDYLLGIGAIELVFELSGIIKIYARKSINGKKK